MTEIAVKKNTQKSEAWLSVITALGAAVTAYTSNIEGAAKWIALGVCLLLAGTFAFFKTPLSSSDGVPGVKTRTFWTSIIVIAGSVAAALAEADVPGLSPKVTQGAAMAVAAITAMGYNIWRYRRKTRKS